MSGMGPDLVARMFAIQAEYARAERDDDEFRSENLADRLAAADEDGYQRGLSEGREQAETRDLDYDGLTDRLAAMQAERDEALDRYAEREQRWHWNLIREQNAICRAEAAEAERDALRERVEALVRFAEYRTASSLSRDITGRPFESPVPLADLRAALDAGQ